MAAAIVMGFSSVVYVASSPQLVDGMRLPTAHEEQLRNINYGEYISQVPDDPGSDPIC